MSPKYKHDCKECTYLKTWPHNDPEFDLYFCKQHGIATVIARYGNEGSQYTSGLSLAAHIPALAKAKTLATEQGLLQ